jgi:hypothetical protein
MLPQTGLPSAPKKEHPMKKLMTLMLGLAFATTTVAVAFAQDPPKTEKKKKTPKKKKAPKKDEKK